MKKRHEQKLVILTIVLMVVFNVPIIFLFDVNKAVFGFPVLFLYVFIVWLVGIVFSYVILKKHYE